MCVDYTRFAALALLLSAIALLSRAPGSGTNRRNAPFFERINIERRGARSVRSSLVKFTAAAAMIGTLAVAIATISTTRDGAGGFAARVGLGGASGTHSAPGYGYGPLYYANDAYAYRGG
jgi:hypothetical protein